MSDIDILMITYNRAEYTRLSLSRLLDTCDESMRIWVWHNGTDEGTLRVVNELRSHPRMYRFHHSPENKRLNEPTNWLWEGSSGEYVGKVDDDCLVPYGWAKTLKAAHSANGEFGVIGCWHFAEEDFVPQLAEKKIQEFADGHRVLRNCWVGGSGYLMKRECFRQNGPLGATLQGFTAYCLELARKGWVNGWYYPLLCQEHMDDPRSANTLLKTDEDILKYGPLSAVKNGVRTVADWEAQLKRSARLMQEVSFDPRFHSGWRKGLRQWKRRLKRCVGMRKQW